MGTEGPLSTVGVAALSDDDGRAGAVFAGTNSPTGNRVLAHRRSSDGRLIRTGAFDTGGRGSGVSSRSPRV